MGTSPPSPGPFRRSRSFATRSFRSCNATVPRSRPCQPTAPPFFPGCGGPAICSTESLDNVRYFSHI